MRKGSIAVFLALTFPLIVVLLFTLIESARYAGLRSVAKTAANSAADSVFAEYDRTLFDEYGVLFYDGGNGQGTIRYDDLEERFLYYFRENMPAPGLFGGTLFPFDSDGAQVTEVVAATDYDGEVFIRSVLDFFKYDVVGSVVDTVMDQLTKMEEGESLKDQMDSDTDQLKNTDWSRIPTAKGGSGDRLRATTKTASAEDGEEPEPIDDRKLKNDLDHSAIGAAETSKAKGWLALVVPTNTEVSAYEMDQSDAPSLSARDDRRLPGSTSIIGSAVEGLGFYEYILDRFGTYISPKSESGMRYEVEYVLYGHDSDVQNFKTALNRIMWIREGMNLLYLVLSEHRTEANALAETLVGWTGNQLIVMLTATALLSAWAYAESILDVRAMLQHKRVAFMKTDETWVLSIGGIENLLMGGGESAKEDELGMRDEDYLRAFLYASDEHTSAYRVMDLIQDAMRRSSPNFLMASMIYAMAIRTGITANELFTALPAGGGSWFLKRKYLWEENVSIVY